MGRITTAKTIELMRSAQVCMEQSERIIAAAGTANALYRQQCMNSLEAIEDSAALLQELKADKTP